MVRNILQRLAKRAPGVVDPQLPMGQWPRQCRPGRHKRDVAATRHVSSSLRSTCTVCGCDLVRTMRGWEPIGQRSDDHSAIEERAHLGAVLDAYASLYREARSATRDPATLPDPMQRAGSQPAFAFPGATGERR